MHKLLSPNYLAGTCPSFLGKGSCSCCHVRHQAVAVRAVCAAVLVIHRNLHDRHLTGKQCIGVRGCCRWYRTVDFGAGWWPLEEAFGKAKARNLPGKSPAFVSEF